MKKCTDNKKIWEIGRYTMTEGTDPKKQYNGDRPRDKVTEGTDPLKTEKKYDKHIQ